MANEEHLKREGEFTYIDVGEGPPLIFLHGLFGALSNFEGPIKHFGGRYRVLMHMLPLYTLPMLNNNVPALADFLDRFVKHLGLTEINLLGNSLGGHVALVYCTKHTDKVRTLILTGSSGLYENAFGGSFPRREDKEYLRKKIRRRTSFGSRRTRRSRRTLRYRECSSRLRPSSSAASISARRRVRTSIRTGSLARATPSSPTSAQG